MQTVVRTSSTPKQYWCDPKRYSELKKMLCAGWKVVMCNRIGDDLEYILERDEWKKED